MSRRWQPSLGFVALCVIYACVAGFFAWGLATPPLDRVWTIQLSLRTGAMPRLSPADHALLEQAMVRHPTLASALLEGRAVGLISLHRDGWIGTPAATIVRTPGAGQHLQLVFDVQTPSDLLPLTASLRGQGWALSRRLRQHGRLEVDLPAPQRLPEIIELELRGSRLEADPSLLGIRVSFARAGEP